MASPRLVAFILMMLPCVAVAVPLGEMKVGKSKHFTAPPQSVVPGSQWVQFSVRLTNTSSKPFWVPGYFSNAPITPTVSLFTRPNNSARWQDYGLGFCGTGIGALRVKAKSSITFTVSIPAKYIGQQLRVDLPVYASPDDFSNRMIISTEHSSIK